MKTASLLSTVIAFCFLLSNCGPLGPKAGQDLLSRSAYLEGAGGLLPTGVRITPAAAEKALFQSLNPDLLLNPDFLAGQAVTTALSPDGQTLLILTSGFNRNYALDGRFLQGQSNEYVFVYDLAGQKPVKRQVLKLYNTFNGLAWHPGGRAFYVTGGVNDNLHVFTRKAGSWEEELPPIGLGHTAGHGLHMRPMAAGVAVNAGGTHALVANFENDSVSLIDLEKHAVRAEVDLRPGKVNAAQRGLPGGEYPFWVTFKGEDKAYVSSQRDNEVVVIKFSGPAPAVAGRIPVGSQPNKMILTRDQKRLYVANGSSDSVSVIDTADDTVLEEINTTAPPELWDNRQSLKGSNPNSLALSPDERFLYVTNGGTNSVAVIRLKSLPADDPSQVIGLISTGWYPNSVSLSRDGSRLYVVNGKSNAGPNPGGCRDTLSIEPQALDPCSGQNQYVWQLTKAGFLSLPLPSEASLARLTWQVGENNRFPSARRHQEDAALMAFIREGIRHVIYIIKENRTYDQVLGDLDRGDGDPRLTLFPEPITPNHHALARQFVTLDHFFDSGEVSGDGWNWSTAARTTDAAEKMVPVMYGGRGLSYDLGGTNRNINVGLGTVEARRAANSQTPQDPDLLPGTADVVAPDGPAGERGTGYLWDAALRKGLSVRNYGFFGDGARYSPRHPEYIPLLRQPFAAGQAQFFPTKPALQGISDPYYRGFDQKNADFWLFKEWEREFDGYVQNGNLPALQLVALPHDHFGDFKEAIDGVNTPDTQMADNDHALGLLVEKVAHSPYKDKTLIFVVEDDAQNGADHIDAHRSLAFIVGPYVKQGAVVSRPFTTVNLVRTIEDVLGLEPLGLTDGLAEPMGEVFEQTLRPWTYNALVPEVLRTTRLPLPPRRAGNSLPLSPKVRDFAKPRRDADHWARVMDGQNFGIEDDLEEERFNRSLWHGLLGEARSYPAVRDGRDWSLNRQHQLLEYEKQNPETTGDPSEK